MKGEVKLRISQSDLQEAVQEHMAKVLPGHDVAVKDVGRVEGKGTYGDDALPWSVVLELTPKEGPKS